MTMNSSQISLPAVSVVIPVYNVEKYLRECLDSVINQTLKEIEIICVDDGSTDSSPSILAEYEKRDARIKAIYQENQGTSQTRKNGVAATSGRFVMFLDGDDEFTPDACEIAFKAISKHRVDIVQFGTEIVNVAGVPEERIRMNTRMLTPYSGKLENKNLASLCWEKTYFSGNLWNKIFRGDLARKAFSEVRDGLFPRGQDWYAFFIIAYFARSYLGIPEPLYRYKFGIGIIGGNSLNEKKFGAVLAQKRVLEGISDFIRNKPDTNEYQSTIQVIRDSFFNQAINAWADKLPPEIITECFGQLIKTWGAEDVVLALAQKKWSTYSAFGNALKLPEICAPASPTKQQKTIVFYYRCISNGGAQRVVADLCNLFAGKTDENGKYLFNVVCVTDSEYDGVQSEYPLSERVARCYVPAFKESEGARYGKRFRAWHKIISEYGADVVVSGLWTDPCTFWDALCVKLHAASPAFIVHSHSFNAVPYIWGEESPKRILAHYRVSDGVVVLSDCDRRYAEQCNSKVHSIVNPLAFNPTKIAETVSEKNTIVWVGRISPEKRPEDVVKMMAEVVTEVPDAKLYLVGGGKGSALKELKTLAHKLKLDANIEFVGFTRNVEKFYGKASVFVSTAEYEGFPLTFAEAMAHGIPIVAYDMPWLTFLRDGRGIVPVERLKPVALAREVVRLLKKPDFAQKLGGLGHRQITEINNVDIVREWTVLFDEIFGISMPRKAFSDREGAELDAINEYFIKAFRAKRSQPSRPRTSLKLPRILVNLGAMFIWNKAARKRWREVHMDLTPKNGIDIQAHPELRRDSALKRFAVRTVSLFIFNKKKRKAFRAKYLNLVPKNGIDVNALSPYERCLRKQKKRERNPLRRLNELKLSLTQELKNELSDAVRTTQDSLDVARIGFAEVVRAQKELERAAIKSYSRIEKHTPNSLEFRTFGDLAHCIRKHLHKLPADADLIVGIPRSGMIPAYTIALFMNKKCCSLDEFLSGCEISNGSRPLAGTQIRKVLVVDDSCFNGRAIGKAKERLAPLAGKYEFVYAAVYGRTESLAKVDYCLEIVNGKRVWQWNYLNHSIAQAACFDMDGVLCVDPTPEENDDGPKYLNFIKNAAPLYIPTYKIRAVVTSRLEKYREATEAWLREHGIEYDELVMLDMATAEERRQANCHAKFKAEEYAKRADATLFVESQENQAKEIAFLTGKEVLCVSTDELY